MTITQTVLIDTTKCWQYFEILKIFTRGWCKGKMVQSIWRIAQMFLIKLVVYLSYGLEVLLLGNYLRDISLQRTSTRIFIQVFFHKTSIMRITEIFIKNGWINFAIFTQKERGMSYWYIQGTCMNLKKYLCCGK